MRIADIDKKIRPYQLNGWQVTLDMTDKELESLKKKRKAVMDIYAVKSNLTGEIVAKGFVKKSDAKIRRNDLCEKTWAKIKDKDAPKPFPYIVTKGKEHPQRRK